MKTLKETKEQKEKKRRRKITTKGMVTDGEGHVLLPA